MCLFPKKVPTNSQAYKHGMREFGCGVCPECLAHKARPWALRATYEAKYSESMMLCLTYDSYIYDSHHRIIGERVASDMKVDKRDCQLFIKRLRKHFPNNKIKYIIAAEYGKRTHRPHYHAIIFGLKFDDLIQYKKSDRGHFLYTSATLSRIWGHGICTVDAVNIKAACARYCTKYAMKDKEADTFMLFSRDIGTVGLLADFNGISYYVDGHEYAIPKLIWRDFLCQKYDIVKPRYRSLEWCFKKYPYQRFDVIRNADNYDDFHTVSVAEDLYERYALTRKRFQAIRDNDEAYKAYLAYWQAKAEANPKNKQTPYERLLLLDDKKYHSYKQACLSAMHLGAYKIPSLVPRSDNLTELYKFKEAGLPNCPTSNPYRKLLRSSSKAREKYNELTSHLPLASCPLTANDTKIFMEDGFWDFLSFNLDTGELYPVIKKKKLS